MFLLFSSFRTLCAKLVLFKTRKKFEIPLCYDFCKMFIEKRISQLSLILSCNSSFIFKIINHSNLIKSRWNEILFCFTLKNKGTTNASTIAIILQPCKLRYLLIIGILPLFSTAHKDEWWIFFLLLLKKVPKKDKKSKQSQLHHYWLSFPWQNFSELRSVSYLPFFTHSLSLRMLSFSENCGPLSRPFYRKISVTNKFWSFGTEVSMTIAI